MEIKYTLEILTKDIQDIGKLVENLQNSPDGSTLELDLALSKLRNVYDILTVIRTDISNSALTRKEPRIAAPSPVPETTVPNEPPISESLPEPEPEPLMEASEPRVETPEPRVETPEPMVETPEPTVEKENKTIGDKFVAESSLNENLAGNREPDMDTKLMGQAIENIGRNIGINDRFMIIRELFDGNSDSFGKLIADLDGAGSLENAASVLRKQFENTPEHEGIAILDNLLRRRYNRS